MEAKAEPGGQLANTTTHDHSVKGNFTWQF
jgi:hypothetical protein